MNSHFDRVYTIAEQLKRKHRRDQLRARQKLENETADERDIRLAILNRSQNIEPRFGKPTKKKDEFMEKIKGKISPPYRLTT